MRHNYLVYLINPYNPDRLPRLFIKQPRETLKEISLTQLAQVEGVVVSYHLEDLFSLLPKTNNFARLEFIDICHAYKLRFGRQFKGKKGAEPWNIWSLINKRYGKLKYIHDLWNYIYAGEKITEKAVLKILDKFVLLIEKIWKAVIKELAKGGEEKRYFFLEKPVNEILLRQHFKGIGISQHALTNRLNILDEKISAADRILRREYGIRDLRNFLEISRVVKEQGFHISDNEEQFSGLLDLYSEHHRLTKALKIYNDSKRDKNILLRLGGVNTDKVYPVYKSLGTVTARILVESPGLQYIRKTNRDILVPEEGKSFLYPDYSQFEPGIMADDSKDKSLIADFNSGDLYQALSLELFKSIEYRNSSKILFLAFCYGMKFERMIELASEISGRSKADVKGVIERFFGKYHSLVEWKMNLEKKLLKEKRIGTKLGNFRYRDSKMKLLTEAEKRWLISQRIQGTASLILKSIILEIGSSLPSVDILLPMHDALLLQVPNNKNGIKDDIQAIFESKFSSYCPLIKPKVLFKDFSEEDKEIESLKV